MKGEEKWHDEGSDFLGELGPSSKDGHSGEWIKASAVADSGAEAHAMPESMLLFLKMVPNHASRAGKAFRGAGNERILAKGKKITRGMTTENNKMVITWQVCPVKRALLSLVMLAKVGNVVKIGAESAHIFNLATRRTTKLRKEGNVFTLEFWIWKPGDTGAGKNLGFARQGPTP